MKSPDFPPGLFGSWCFYRFLFVLKLGSDASAKITQKGHYQKKRIEIIFRIIAYVHYLGQETIVRFANRL